MTGITERAIPESALGSVKLFVFDDKKTPSLGGARAEAWGRRASE
jgi:hypothetical protein